MGYGSLVAFSEALASRVRELLDNQPITERKMFGGLAFLYRGNMACGIVGEELMVRVGKDAHEECLAQPHARPMDFTGKAMKGMVYVGVEGLADQSELGNWVQRGVNFAESLPPKPGH